MRTITVRGPRGSVWTIDQPTTRRERARGLRGRAPLANRQGMFFERCRSVHTFGMRTPITVVALDADDRVVTVRTIRPRRVLVARPSVRHILECAADADVRSGDRFDMSARSERRREEAPAALRRWRR